MPPKSKSKTALIVEDERDLRQFAAWVLEAEGYNVLQAADGNEGLKIARQNRVDVILLDIRLPLTNGWVLLREFKNTSKLAKVPVVILTASADPSLKLQALQMGATDFLAKPVSADVLKKAITRALKKN
jgi:DNA-binding response OmpR family regulator